MTIYRCEPIPEAQLNFQYVSANDPDTIGIEVCHEDNMLFGVDMYEDGRLTIMFDDAENAQFNMVEFKRLLERCEAELIAWRDNLIRPGSVWDQP